ncbi:hypothetical protein [Pseudoalteromonas gelatinilytica]
MLLANLEGVSKFFVSMNASDFGRLGYILENLDSILDVVILDQSINTRLTHIYYSIYGSFESYLVPNGASYWPSYIQSKAIGPLLWSTGLETTERINSGIGQVFFELGFLGLLIFFFIYKSIIVNKNKKESIWLFLTIILFMLNTLNLSYPPFCLLIAYLIVRNKNDICRSS